MDVFPEENEVIGTKIEANSRLEFSIMQREAKPLLITSNFCTTIIAVQCREEEAIRNV